LPTPAIDHLLVERMSWGLLVAGGIGALRLTRIGRPTVFAGGVTPLALPPENDERPIAPIAHDLLGRHSWLHRDLDLVSAKDCGLNLG
jgi:hypothetical protein